MAEPSTPLDTNTTASQIQDIERLREHLGVERWVVFGVSWGVTLGLAYAQRHPYRVSGMVLAAVTAGRRSEIEWITRDVGRIFPREWEQFRDAVPEAERAGSLPAAYATLLAHPDAAVRDAAAQAWCAWEDTHVSLMPGWAPDPRFADPMFRFLFARLVTHYWSNDCFLTGGDEILSNMTAIAEIPAELVHGRYDVSGPLETAWSLHRAWPASELVVLGDAGHGGKGFAEARATALKRLAGCPRSPYQGGEGLPCGRRLSLLVRGPASAVCGVPFRVDRSGQSAAWKQWSSRFPHPGVGTRPEPYGNGIPAVGHCPGWWLLVLDQAMQNRRRGVWIRALQEHSGVVPEEPGVQRLHPDEVRDGHVLVSGICQ